MSCASRELPIGCVLAGGRSSRMGREKAALVIEGESFLARAVRALSPVCTRVVISGTMAERSAGLTLVPDAVSDQGPLGGVVTALRFAASAGASWVMFLPVDMPLLPMSLLPVLRSEWVQAGARGARACCAEADGRLQPLISMVHVTLAPHLAARLDEGDLRVGPGLLRGAEELAGRPEGRQGKALVRTEVAPGDSRGTAKPAGWRPTDGEWRVRSWWFVNVNTPADFAGAVEAARA